MALDHSDAGAHATHPRSRRRRRNWRIGTVAVLAAGFVVVPDDSASAHPLGNFSRNVYAGLTISPEKITIDHVLDLAEIPTFQEHQIIDTNGDGTLSDAELSAYKTASCANVASALHLCANGGSAIPLVLRSSALSFPPGAADLPTQRLECTFDAASNVAGNGINEIAFRDDLESGRVGWHEITAVGDGVRLNNSNVPTTSQSNRLTTYPAELTASPLAVTSAELSWVVDPSVVLAATNRSDASKTNLGAASVLTAGVPGGVDAATQAFTGLITEHSQSLAFVLLAFVLAILLGGLHALAPGHGKTLMAGYLLGAGGRTKDALMLGATVTVTHTAGVLILGIALATTTAFAPESAYPWLGIGAGVLSVGAGLSLVWSLRKGGLDGHGHSHGPGGHTHGPAPIPHAHPHDDGAPQGGDSNTNPALSTEVHANFERVPASVALLDPHEHVHHADHDHPKHQAPTRRRLVVLGLAGGLIPSPSAVVVLLAGIALGKPVLAVALVIAYGIGMAGVLAGAGILVLRARGLVERRLGEGTLPGPISRIARAMPLAAAGVVVVAGLVLIARSIGAL